MVRMVLWCSFVMVYEAWLSYEKQEIGYRVTQFKKQTSEVFEFACDYRLSILRKPEKKTQ